MAMETNKIDGMDVERDGTPTFKPSTVLKKTKTAAIGYGHSRVDYETYSEQNAIELSK